MKNIISGFKSTIKSVGNIVKEGIDSLRNITKTKVGAVLAAGTIGLGTNVYASENWVMVDKPGIGPGEFSQKYFGTSNWKLLRDRDGNLIKNPRTDFILGREYTIFSSDNSDKKIEEPKKEKYSPVEIITKKEEPEEEKQKIIISTVRREEELKKESVLKEKMNYEKDVRVKKVGKMDYYMIPKETYPAEVSNFVSKYNFNYEAFVNSVIRKESNGKPSAFHRVTRATGLTQFLPTTLIGLGYHKGGELSEKMMSSFKNNINLQFKYIHKYNAETFRIISQSPELIDRELKKGKDIATILVEFGAEANFAGHRSIGKGWNGNDGTTSIPKYKKDVLSYFREIVAANDDSFDTRVKVASDDSFDTRVKVASIIDNQGQDRDNLNVTNIKKVKVSSNDRFFDSNIGDITRKPELTEREKAIELKFSDAISKIKDTKVAKSISENIANSNITSFEYFQRSLDHYKSINDKAREKKIRDFMNIAMMENLRKAA